MTADGGQQSLKMSIDRKWNLRFVDRPLNKIVNVYHEEDHRGSFTIDNDDPESYQLWLDVAKFLHESQKNDAPHTRIN